MMHVEIKEEIGIFIWVLQILLMVYELEIEIFANCVLKMLFEVEIEKCIVMMYFWWDVAVDDFEVEYEIV